MARQIDNADGLMPSITPHSNDRQLSTSRQMAHAISAAAGPTGDFPPPRPMAINSGLA